MLTRLCPPLRAAQHILFWHAAAIAALLAGLLSSARADDDYDYNPLEAALGFTVFVSDDMALGGGHVHGGTAVGGNLVINGQSVFGQNSAGSYKVDGSDTQYTSLVVGGTLITSGSYTIGAAKVSAGNSATINSGWLSLGSTSGLNLWNVERKAESWTSTTSSQYAINSGTSYGTTPSLTSNVSESGSTITRSSGIDFDAQLATLTSVSNYIATLATNCVYALSTSGVLSITLNTTSVSIINLTAAEFASISSVSISGTLSSSTGLIFNVSGETINFGNLAIGEQYSSYILYNFSEATSITMSSTAIDGSILATNAIFYHGDSSSNIDGQVIVKSYVQTGGGEIHNDLLNITIPMSAAVPEPATYAAIVGCAALGFVVWQRRRRKA